MTEQIFLERGISCTQQYNQDILILLVGNLEVAQIYMPRLDGWVGVGGLTVIMMQIAV